jgi:predicted RNA polymerase sigma factor
MSQDAMAVKEAMENLVGRVGEMTMAECGEALAGAHAVTINPRKGTPQDAAAAHIVVNGLIDLLDKRIAQLKEQEHGRTEASANGSTDTERPADDEAGADTPVHPAATRDDQVGGSG